MEYSICKVNKKPPKRFLPLYTPTHPTIPFALPISCTGFREQEWNRFETCPCLVLTVSDSTHKALTQRVIPVVKFVSENKLSEAQGMIADQQIALGIPPTVMPTLPRFDINLNLRQRLMWLVEYIRREKGIPATLETFAGGSTEAFTFHGPVYLFVNVANNRFTCRIVFPSLDKQGQPWSNFDHLGKAHRWVDRLLNSSVYTHLSNCNTSCETYAPPQPPRRRPVSIKTPPSSSYGSTIGGSPYQKTVSFTVYALNFEHPSIKPFVSKHPNARNALLYNILPTNWEMQPRCRQMLISENQKYYLMLQGNTFGVYENVRNEDLMRICREDGAPANGKFVFGINLNGKVTSAVLDKRELTISGQTDPAMEEDVLWSLDIADASAQLPISLVLNNDGSLSVIDATNRNVMIPTFLDYTSTDSTNKQGKSYMGYDPDAVYQERIWRLIYYLEGRTLVSKIVLPDKESLKKLEIQYQDFTPTTPFDPSVNYKSRLQDLLNYLRGNYPNAQLPKEYNSSIISSKLQIQYADEARAHFDPKEVLMQRLQSLLELSVSDPTIRMQSVREYIALYNESMRK